MTKILDSIIVGGTEYNFGLKKKADDIIYTEDKLSWPNGGYTLTDYKWISASVVKGCEIDVSNHKKITLLVPVYTSETSFGIAFLDSSGNYISGNNLPVGTTCKYEEQTIDIPSDAVTMCVMAFKDNTYGVWQCKLTEGKSEEEVSKSGGYKSRTIRVAASNSSSRDKSEADYLCTGTNDELIVQKAINAAGTCGKVLLAVGLYNIDSFQKASDGANDYALSFPTDTKIEMCCDYGNPKLSATNDYQGASKLCAIFRVTDSCYNSLDASKQYTIIRNRAPMAWSNYLVIRNIGISIPDNQKKIIGIDCWYSMHAVIKEVRIVTITGGGGSSLDYQVPPEGSIGFRGMQGSNDGIRDLFQDCAAYGFYEGFAISGEHFVGIALLARNNYYGFTFNKYTNTNGAWRHPMTIINSADELSARMPYFGHNGESGQTLLAKQGQAITFIDFNVEWLPAFRNQEGGGIYATEALPGEWSGSIHYTIQPSYGGSEKSDPTYPFWANDGSGKNIKSFNDGQAQQTDKKTLKTYAPNYNQVVYCTDLQKPLICTNPATKEWRDFTGEVVTL